MSPPATPPPGGQVFREDGDAGPTYLWERYWEGLRRDEWPDPDGWLAAHAGAGAEDPGRLTVLRLVDAARRAGRPAAADEPPEEPARPPVWPDATRLEGGELCILGRLHAGGMGETYLAWHQTMNRPVVVKVALDPAGERRFRREIEIHSRLGAHDHIALARYAGRHAGRYYLVMDYLEGSDLARLVRQGGPLPVADACAAARQAALGLQYAHERLGIVHRDVKPSNLMLTPGGTVKLLDFGLARWDLEGPEAAAAPGEPTTGDAIMGTADYMAPEQWRDSHTVGARADMYSLGCTLYHLLAGHPPFAGPEYDTTGKKMMAHAHAPVPPIREQRPEVPAALASVLGRLLAKQPEARFSTPAEVGAALQPFTGGSDLARLLEASGATPGRSARPPAPVAGATVKSVRQRRRLQPRWLAATAGALLVLTLAALWSVSSSRPPGLGRLVTFFWPPGGHPTPPAPRDLRVVSLEIEGYRKKPVQALGKIGTDCYATRFDDFVRVRAELSEPAYCYLIAFNPDGKDQLCYPADEATPPMRLTELTFPHQEAKGFRLNDGVGLQAFVLVASWQPLPPYAEWKTGPGVAAWKPVDGDGVWQFDGRRFVPRGTARGKIQDLAGLPGPFAELCESLRGRPGVDALQALAFPVKRGEEAPRPREE
jgi:hypothetical protein